MGCLLRDPLQLRRAESSLHPVWWVLPRPPGAQGLQFTPPCPLPTPNTDPTSQGPQLGEGRWVWRLRAAGPSPARWVSQSWAALRAGACAGEQAALGPGCGPQWAVSTPPTLPHPPAWPGPTLGSRRQGALSSGEFQPLPRLHPQRSCPLQPPRCPTGTRQGQR